MIMLLVWNDLKIISALMYIQDKNFEKAIYIWI